MNKQLKLEHHILQRIQYLLEEASVIRATESDPQFAHYIDQLYDDLDEHAAELGKAITA
jgi:hypothetical protein